ncbi:hypothetical protein D3C87_1457280 [compost metagenome]
MVTRQSQDPLGGLILGRFRRRHISETAPEQVGQFDLARAAQIEDQGNMIEARVPLHPRGDRQGRRLFLPAPQHRGVKRALMQIVKSRIGRRRCDDLGARRRQGVGHG